MEDEDFLPISALQHLLYCERQCALIHLERAWEENSFTAQGRILHERVDSGENEKRGDLYVARAIPLRSRRLKLQGKADVVEFRKIEVEEQDPGGADLRAMGLMGKWMPRPVEYKRGKVKLGPFDEVQVCAQAMCLEESFGVSIPEGDLYYNQPRRRHTVSLGSELRRKTQETAARLHALFNEGKTPPPEPGKKCEACSLRDICMPWSPVHRATAYYQSLFEP